MRKTIYMLFAVLGMGLLGGCSDNDDKPSAAAKQLAGEWQLTTWTGEKPEAFEAYLSFDATGGFTIYQKIEAPVFTVYTGSYLLQDRTLSGKYSDNTAWGSTYEVGIDEKGNTLTLTSADKSDLGVYTRTTIPEAVKAQAVAPDAVRAVQYRLL